MDKCLIQFHTLEKDFLPPPVPATHSIPDWMKGMPNSAATGDGPPLGTIKQCPPFLDAMSSGYLIPTIGDVEFVMDEAGQLTCHTPDHQAGIDKHPPVQLMGSPWEKMPVVKFLNPWLIVTPPGYSTLFVQPLNRLPIPFILFSGVVETDSFYREVNFPAACLMQPRTRFTLARGTPLVQAIPFKRDRWESEIRPTDAERRNEMYRQISMNKDIYRDWFHEKKVYT